MDIGSTFDMNSTEEDNKKANLWTPKVITGGKGPPDAPDKDWLIELPQHTYFIARPKGFKGFEAFVYHLDYKFKLCALLSCTTPDKEIDFHVVMKDFSRDMELIEIIEHDTPITYEPDVKVTFVNDQSE